MRTTVVIDDELMADAMRATGARTKRKVVELGLRTLARLHQQRHIRNYRGEFAWSGDLGTMRSGT